MKNSLKPLETHFKLREKLRRDEWKITTFKLEINMTFFKQLVENCLKLSLICIFGRWLFLFLEALT